MSGFFSSPEFYVIATIAAAAIVAGCIRPQQKGPAIERLLGSALCDASDTDTSPRVTISCEPDGMILLTRHGLSAMTDNGAVSIAATRTGTDVILEERVVHSPAGQPVDTALFTLDFLPTGRYHIQYRSEPYGLFAAFSLTVRPGNEITRPLTR